MCDLLRVPAVTPRDAAVLALLAGAVPGAARADRCAPRAEVTGEDPAVALVTAELQRLGVVIGAATAGCPSVAATVHDDGHGGIAVTLRDGNRSDDRDVGAPAVAAAWIDAWLRDDQDWRADLAPAPGPIVEDAAPPVRAPAVVAQVVAAPAPEAPGRLARISVAAGYQQAWTGDSGTWHGFAAAACVHADAWCFGARGYGAAQEFATGQSAVSRGDLALLATAAYAVPIARLAIVPELGLGVGRMTTARHEVCPPPCAPGDQACMMTPMPCGDGSGTYVGDHLSASTVAPRASAAVRVEVPLVAHVWLDGSAALSLAPFGHGDAFPATRNAPGVPPDQLALPGEPVAAFQLAVGLRVGLP